MYKRYNNKLEYSYCLGAYPTIELINSLPEQVVEIIVHSQFTEKSNEGYRIVSRLAGEKQIPLRCNDKIIAKLTPKENCYVIGFFKKYRQKLQNNNHTVLVNPTNTGNLGTIIRTMAAFTYHDLAIIEPAVDLFNPQTIRSSMGSMFRLRVQYFSDISDYIKAFPQHNRYLLMTDGSNLLNETTFHSPCSIIFGNEASGLRDEFKTIGTPVRIKQSDDVDSLNLAVCVGIALHNTFQE